MRRRRIVAGLTVPILALAGLWSFWLEPASLRNEVYVLSLPSWPESCNAVRIAVLSDLHVGSPYNGLPKLQSIVNLTQSSHPDLILLAGDYVIHGVVGGTFTPPEEMAKALSHLSAPLGIYAVLGNHDWWLDRIRVRRALESARISVLEDASIPIRQGSCHFWLSGVSDFMEGPHDVHRALRDIPNGEPIVLFTHNPDIFPEVPAHVSLTIAGHTHGGQVNLPLVGRPIVPSAFGQRYAAGHIVENGKELFVTTGVGTSIIPVRFGVVPEVTLLRLERAP
jgi:predicted MPP superfamily phosphohydrolase